VQKQGSRGTRKSVVLREMEAEAGEGTDQNRQGERSKAKQRLREVQGFKTQSWKRSKQMSPTQGPRDIVGLLIACTEEGMMPVQWDSCPKCRACI
jgi:hypothetical protein